MRTSWKMRIPSLVLLGMAIACTGLQAFGGERQHRHAVASEGRSEEPCYTAGDPQQVRLWEGRAPGAAGDDPCRDIPYLQVVLPPKSSASGAAVLIIPGGGYDNLTNAKEQGPVAAYFAQNLHVAAFVLRYRLVQPDGTYRYPVPMWDGQRALKLIRARAPQFGIDSRRVAVFGFSAGGHLASTLTLHSATDFALPAHDAVDAQPGRPDLLGLGYSVISMDPADVPPSGSYRNLLRGYDGSELSHLQTYLSGEKNITPRTPPVFLFESQDDTVISPRNSVLFAEALKAQGVPVEEHLFSHGKHGAGLAADIPEESAWTEMFRHWLVARHFIPE